MMNTQSNSSDIRLFYYDPDTHQVNERCFYDEQKDHLDWPSFPLTFKEWCEKLSAHSGYQLPFYEDGEIIFKDDPAQEEEIAAQKKADEISDLKSFLSSTDYVVAKLQELSLTDPDGFEEARNEYAETLRKRKEARERINELEGDE